LALEALYEWRERVRRRGYRKAAERLADGFAADFEVVGGEAIADAVGPFDEGEAARFKIFFGAELEELVCVAEAISVEVVDREAAVVFVHEDERGASSLVARNSECGGDGLDQARFASAERADKGDRGSRRQGGGEGGAEAVGVVLVC
jgi:hypothetical protein